MTFGGATSHVVWRSTNDNGTYVDDTPAPQTPTTYAAGKAGACYTSYTLVDPGHPSKVCADGSGRITVPAGGMPRLLVSSSGGSEHL